MSNIRKLKRGLVFTRVVNAQYKYMVDHNATPEELEAFKAKVNNMVRKK